MIHPNSRFKICWELYVLIITVIVGIQAPIIIVFDLKPEGTIRYFDLFVTITFSLDIILTFTTKVIDKKRRLETPSAVAKDYLKWWFWIDLLATIPFDLLYAQMPIASASRLFKLFRLTRLFRLLRLVRIAQMMKQAKKSNTFNSNILRLVFMVFWIAFAAHFIAVGWIAVIGNPSNLTMNEQYLQAFYWTITTLTTIGYGDVTPNIQHTSLVIYVIIIEILGAGMYGFIIGNISSVIANLDIAKTQYKEKLEKINTFMKYRALPMELQTDINEYYAYLWDSRRGYDEQSVLEELPISLKTKVSLFLNKRIIESVPIFEGASEAFIKEVILNLEPVIFTPGDIIVKKGDVGFDMFFISKGSVDVVSEDFSTVYATLNSGNFFGEIALLFSSPRTASIRAREYCDVYRFKKEMFDSILERYPEFALRIKELAKKRQDETHKTTKNKLEAIKQAHSLNIKNLHSCQKGEAILLQWEKVVTNDNIYFEVIRQNNSAPDQWKILQTKIGKSTFIDKHPIVEQNNSYKVRAVSEEEKGPWSNAIHCKLEQKEE